jgi:hypothetical protein
MIYTYDASNEGEISVPEGRDLVVLEPDGRFSSCLIAEDWLNSSVQTEVDG